MTPSKRVCVSQFILSCISKWLTVGPVNRLCQNNLKHYCCLPPPDSLNQNCQGGRRLVTSSAKFENDLYGKEYISLVFRFILTYPGNTLENLSYTYCFDKWLQLKRPHLTGGSSVFQMRPQSNEDWGCCLRSKSKTGISIKICWIPFSSDTSWTPSHRENNAKRKPDEHWVALNSVSYSQPLHLTEKLYRTSSGNSW